MYKDLQNQTIPNDASSIADDGIYVDAYRAGNEHSPFHDRAAIRHIWFTTFHGMSL